MRIGLDLDGCLADFNGGFADVLGVRLPPGHPTTWHWPQYYGCTDERIAAAWASVRSSASFWSSLRVLDPLAIEAIRWTQDEHEYAFLTARVGETCEQQTRAWITSHGIHRFELHVTTEKHRHGVEVMIDDRPENLTVTPGIWRVGYLVDQPWNQWMPPTDHVIRVVSTYAALRQCGAVT